MKLLVPKEAERWNQKVAVATFPLSIVQIKLNKYMEGDAIEYYKTNATTPSGGWGWPEMYANPTSDATQTIARDALSVVAALISHCDNFDENQGLMCLDDDDSTLAVDSSIRLLSTKDSCKGKKIIYIHDVGGTLGNGWNLLDVDAWPNYMDLKQWQNLSVWGDLNKCDVYVNGLPGCSWNRNLHVSEDGRSMASRLLKQLTDQQIEDLFVASRANFMRGDSVQDWISGFKAKLNRDIFSVSCQ